MDPNEITGIGGRAHWRHNWCPYTADIVRSPTATSDAPIYWRGELSAALERAARHAAWIGGGPAGKATA